MKPIEIAYVWWYNKHKELDMENAPNKTPNTLSVEHFKDVVHRLGRFIAPQQVEMCLTNYRPRGAEEMLANTQPTLFDQIESD